jgi:dTDP-4-dehydrorhamnose reductase
MTSILVTGGQGQIGLELARAAWPEELVLRFPTRDELDIGSAESIARYFEGRQFAAVINAAAYTAVDRAEEESSAAFAINAMGPALVAEVTRRAGIPLIQMSTDYVFDGSKPSPYIETDPVHPLGSYGASKLAGELAVLAGNPRSVVLRTAWVLSVHRSNFLKTMLRVGATNPQIRVVDDQVGCPTSASDIADALKTIVLRMIEDDRSPVGIFHFVNAGQASWYGLAREIFALSGAAGGPRAEVTAITSAEYPTPARRPANSRLATGKIAAEYGIEPRQWHEAVAEIIDELMEPASRAGAQIR